MAQRGTWKIFIGEDEFANYDDVVSWSNATGGPKIQEADTFRGAPFRAERANVRIPRVATVTREHADNAISAEYFLNGSDTWGGVADVKLFHLDYTGVEARFLIAGAAVTLSIAEPIGPTTITQLTILGGKAVPFT